jgi:uncharacterized protein involved in outer membrane biogenesis
VAYPSRVERPSILDSAQGRWRAFRDRRRERRKTDAAPKSSGRTWTIAGAIFGAVILAVVLFLTFFDWDYARGPISRYASGRIGRPVAIDGHLRVHLLTWTPTATVGGLRIANPPGRPGDMTNIQQLTVSVKLTPLLRGRVILPLVQANAPKIDLFRDAQGHNNWTFKGKSPGEPTRLPAIRRFEINDGHLRIEDQVRHLTFIGTVASSEVVGERTVQGFRLRGDGALNKEPFRMNLIGGPLLNVDPDRPYPFDADIHAGATTVQAKGQITKPFDLGHFHTTLKVTGPDMADLFPLTGLALPTTPPYSVSGQLIRNDHDYRYEGLNGRVGDSDLHGWLGVKTGRAAHRPLLTGDLHSSVLSFSDLQTVFGGGVSKPKPKVAPVKPRQVQIANRMQAQGLIIPDTPISVDRLRKMDADVKYRAGSIRSKFWPITAGSTHIRLDNALLRLDDLTFTLPQGRMAGELAINARQQTPSVDLDMKMTGARLEQFLPTKFKAGVSGGLVGRAKLHGTGKSMHQAAANADGSFAVVVPHGQIREAFAELMGVDVTKALGLLWSKKQSTVDVRCAVASFQARDGVLSANHLVFDTTPVQVRGGGTIDLRNETLDLKVKGKPKEFRLVRLIVPVRLEGRIRSPKIHIETGTAIGQVGLGAVLGSVLAPLATILPFVDNGLAKDADCAGLMQAAPAPVTAKQVAQVPPGKHPAKH